MTKKSTFKPGNWVGRGSGKTDRDRKSIDKLDAGERLISEIVFGDIKYTHVIRQFIDLLEPIVQGYNQPVPGHRPRITTLNYIKKMINGDMFVIHFIKLIEHTNLGITRVEIIRIFEFYITYLYISVFKEYPFLYNVHKRDSMISTRDVTTIIKYCGLALIKCYGFDYQTLDEMVDIKVGRKNGHIFISNKNLQKNINSEEFITYLIENIIDFLPIESYNFTKLKAYTTDIQGIHAGNIDNDCQSKYVRKLTAYIDKFVTVTNTPTYIITDVVRKHFKPTSATMIDFFNRVFKDDDYKEIQQYLTSRVILSETAPLSSRQFCKFDDGDYFTFPETIYFALMIMEKTGALELCIDILKTEELACSQGFFNRLVIAWDCEECILEKEPEHFYLYKYIEDKSPYEIDRLIYKYLIKYHPQLGKKYGDILLDNNVLEYGTIYRALYRYKYKHSIGRFIVNTALYAIPDKTIRTSITEPQIKGSAKLTEIIILTYLKLAGAGIISKFKDLTDRLITTK